MIDPGKMAQEREELRRLAMEHREVVLSPSLILKLASEDLFLLEWLERVKAAALEALRRTAIETAHHAGAEWVWCAICHKYGRFPSEIEHADDCVFTALEAKP